MTLPTIVSAPTRVTMLAAGVMAGRLASGVERSGPGVADVEARVAPTDVGVDRGELETEPIADRTA
jgi:hypothetical protein